MSYGQNPYGQNPHGGQPQQPYGQRPYGGQQPNPYGQPQQNPYGQPGQNPYGQPQQNPYAPPGQGQGQGQPGQQAPYGRQQGQPQNPYAQPGQHPQYGQPQQGQHPYGAQQPPPAESWRANQPPAAPDAGATRNLTMAEHVVPVHTLLDDPESFITRSLGEVIGVALRPRTNDVAALTRARQDAVSRMAEMAKAADADAVVGLRFDSNPDEVVAYGTAVLLADDLDVRAETDAEGDSASDWDGSARSADSAESHAEPAAGEETPLDESAEQARVDQDVTLAATSTDSDEPAATAGEPAESGEPDNSGYGSSEGGQSHPDYGYRPAGYDFNAPVEPGEHGQQQVSGQPQSPYSQNPYGQPDQSGQSQGWPFSSRGN